MSSFKDFKICEILKIKLFDDLIGLYFNLRNEDEEKCIALEISDGGEMIVFSSLDKWIFPVTLTNQINTVMMVDSNDKVDVLRKLIGCVIEESRFGVDKAINLTPHLYYFQLKSRGLRFLFFNNGDKGSFCFDDEIDAILGASIYDIVWTHETPSIQM